MDNSLGDGKVQELKISLFTDSNPTTKVAEALKLLLSAVGQNEPMSLFGLTGKKQTAASYHVENSPAFFVIKAVGQRADELKLAAETIRQTPAEQRELLEHQFESKAVDYTQVEGVLTVCRMLQQLNYNLVLTIYQKHLGVGKKKLDYH